MKSGRPPEILWGHLNRMADLIASGTPAVEAAARVADDPIARRSARRWDPVAHRFRREAIQPESLATRLLRQWNRYSDEIERERAGAAAIDTEANIWQHWRKHPECGVDADVLLLIVERHRRGTVADDPLLDAIVTLLDRAQMKRDKIP